MMNIQIAFILTTSAVFLTAFAVGPVSSPAPSPGSYLSPPLSPEASLSPTALPPANDCLTSLYSLIDCEDYVMVGSNSTKPNKECCPELADLVKSNPICLCQLFKNTTDTLGFEVDLTRALKLPSVCNVSTPPVSLCSVINGEGSVSPGAQPPEGFAAASPSTTGNDNGALHITGSAIACLVGLAIAFLPIFF